MDGGNKKMKRKIVSIFICTLLIATTIINIPTDSNVKASGQGGENNNYYLNYTYMNEQTEWMGNVIHDNTIWEGDIRKGRAFATKGGHATENHIEDELEDMNLEEVKKEPIGPLEDKPFWYYSNKLETIDYRFQINHPDYEYETGFPSKVPKNETFPLPSALYPNQNYTFNGVRVYRFEDLPLTPDWRNEDYYNLSYEQVETDFAVLGNTSYIPLNETLPEYQEGMVFMINESEGCESKLNNATNASGVILIHETYTADTSNCCAPVVRIPHNDTNLTEVLDLLENGTVIIVSNVNNNETLTFEPVNGDRCWPAYKYMALVETTGSDVWKTLKYPYIWSIRFRINPINLCKGFIVYDNKTNENKGTHIMGFSTRTWKGYSWLNFDKFPEKVPGLPVFSVNYTVGKFLHDNCYDTDDVLNITGSYLNQKFSSQSSSGTPGVEANNVVGKIYSDENPDKVTVISGRPDGWWGETTGDSGASGAIVLAIAKYMKKLETEYDIKPNYNITYLFTTGEEYGMRGAYHYRDKYKDSTDFVRWIGLDQLGWNEDGQKLGVFARDTGTQNVVEAVENITDYEGRTSYEFELFDATKSGGSEDTVWKKECDTVCFVKDPTDYTSYDYHRAGEDFTNGDCLDSTDWNDLNVTLEFFWGIVKYFCYAPADCLFEGDVTYQAIDSENDGDSRADSIKASFRLNTSFPCERVVVKGILKEQPCGNSVGSLVEDYLITTEGNDCEFIFPIPDNQTDGNYKLQLELYNFTGMINDLMGSDPGNYNDSDISSSSFELYHPFGYPHVGESLQSLTDRVTGSLFTTTEYGIADNITAYVNFLPCGLPSKNSTCLLYRANDSVLIGQTENLSFSTIGGVWKTYEFQEPKPFLYKDTEYILVCWGEGDGGLYYDDYVDVRGRYNETSFGGPPPDPADFNNENRLYSIYCGYTAVTPEITDVSATPNTVGFGFNVTINAEFYDPGGLIDMVKVNISYSDNNTGNYTMDDIGNNTYEYVFNDSWLVGQYNYSIWAVDIYNNTYSSPRHGFNVSAMGSTSVCTIKDEYGNNEPLNITDPPCNTPLIGYELLENNDVLHLWNFYNSYYFDTDSGIQLTNHYNEYWSHNALMLGYYNNDEWNLIYRTDELSGFNKDIESDNETFVNATLWKDLSYGGYDFRLAIRYHLGIDDNELTVSPYIKNLGVAIPYTLGFGWEMKDIQINMTETGDYINVNRTIYYLNQTLDNTYTDLSETEFYLMENITGTSTKSLYLKWNQSLNYKLCVKSRDGQYNAPVTLFIKVGTLDSGQEKYTKMFWYDAEQVTYYFNSFDDGPMGETWVSYPSFMVDGSTSTHASTTVNGDVELCDENDCSGDDLGTISMVELRVASYYSGSQRDTILRPVFGGTVDGLDYHYQTETQAGTGWSSWFDITDDPFAPRSWTWSDVEGLDCDVEAESDMGMFTLYCSKVEMRVTYTLYNYDPVVSNPGPDDGATGVSIQPLLNITVYDPDGDNMNITWLSNSSGSWQIFGTNSSVGNGTYHQIMGNASENGKWWYWKVNVSDGEDYTVSNVYKFYTGYQSKIENTGSTDIKGYLLIQVQYYNSSSSNWVVADDTVNETSPRTINISEQLGLDTVFNGLVNTSNISGFGNGTYRIYAAFRDPNGNILIGDDEAELVATYEFTVTFE